MLVSLFLSSGCEGWLENLNNLKTPCQLPLLKKSIVKIQWRSHWSPDSFMQIHCVDQSIGLFEINFGFLMFWYIYMYTYIYINFFLKHTTHTSLNRVNKGLTASAGYWWLLDLYSISTETFWDTQHLPPKFLKPPRSPPLQRKNWRNDFFLKSLMCWALGSIYT